MYGLVLLRHDAIHEVLNPSRVQVVVSAGACVLGVLYGSVLSDTAIMGGAGYLYGQHMVNTLT